MLLSLAGTSKCCLSTEKEVDGMKFFEIEDALDEMEFHDWSLKATVAHECAWSVELRITPETNPSGCDEGIVFYATGAVDPLAGAERVFEACREWKHLKDFEGTRYE